MAATTAAMDEGGAGPAVVSMPSVGSLSDSPGIATGSATSDGTTFVSALPGIQPVAATTTSTTGESSTAATAGPASLLVVFGVDPISPELYT